MNYALIILLATLQSSAVEVWTGGDDGLTQRFASLFRTTTQQIQTNDRSHRIRAVVEQITPRRRGKVHVVVTFHREGERIGIIRCTAIEDNLARCAARASAAAERLIANVQ
ncbi:hypothetical protein [Sphingomonas dokdonensis]|uniref:hypothetical protein n=1 Tax=Sphingomonas dokdonensis TaxID=344880 RepID=UPI00117A5909|nr:hypothetical protein [Sphingomonas dokdonensis]